jgi:hypothetical protein
VTVKVALLDLTVDQVEALELEFGKPIDGWIDLPSRAQLYRRVYAVVTGTDPAAVGAMTMRELTEAVSLGDEQEQPEGAETTNPT